MTQLPFENLREMLEYRAASAPKLPGFRYLPDGETEGASLSFEQLDDKARRIASALLDRHQPGDRAVLLFTPGLDFVSAFYGCIYAGMVAVPAYPLDPSRLQRTLPRLERVVEHSGAACVLTDGSFISLAEHPDGSRRAGAQWLKVDDLLASAPGGELPSIDSGALALIQYTSGSTGLPKGVVLSHQALLANLYMMWQDACDVDPYVGVNWLPVSHDMGLLAGVLIPVFRGGLCVHMSPLHFLQRPARWLEAIARHRAVVSGGPNFGYELCLRKVDPAEVSVLDLSSWECAFNGAEPVRADTLRGFAKLCEPAGFKPTTLAPCYGLAEASLIVATSRRTEVPSTRSVDPDALATGRVRRASNGSGRELIGCGTPCRGTELCIVEPASRRRLGRNQVGEIWIASPSVASEYWRDDEASRARLRATLSDGGAGEFLRSGDLGFVDDSGELFVTGRRKDMLIVEGRNLYPHDLEQTVQRCDPLLRNGCGAVFAVNSGEDERVVVVQEVRAGELDSGLRNRVRAAIVREHGVAPYAIELIRAGTLPKTSSGKIQRSECRRHFLDGSLEVVAPGQLRGEA
ncbi:MAG: fatty acyl-AMP ligase [Myxococcales bacterium]|nr:fatty acyl-AMP ligase [Myxococcales bacterium]